jgi:thiamine-monophosphate kinase
MMRMSEILENAAIERWARRFASAPHQINERHTADSEIIAIPGRPDPRLAVTVDTVAEEIAAGLYRDPFTMGWTSVMASLSDLAAVGAAPLGILLSVAVDPERDDALIDGIASGIESACRASGAHVLGGDTNASSNLAITVCSLGLIEGRRTLTRIGCSPGEALYMTGRAGLGNALAAARFLNAPESAFSEASFRPRARLAEGRLLRRWASACMDTSDGLLATLDQLMRLNGCGFELQCDWNRILAPEALALCRRTNAPQWAMLAAPHGEFELVFTVPGARERAFLDDARKATLDLTRLGTACANDGITFFDAAGRRATVDTGVARNLYLSARGDCARYMRDLLAWGRNAGLGDFQDGNEVGDGSFRQVP